MTTFPTYRDDLPLRQALFNAATAIARLARKANRHPHTRAVMLQAADELRNQALAILADEIEHAQAVWQMVDAAAPASLIEPLQECQRCRVHCAPGMACVSTDPGHVNAERPCRPAPEGKSMDQRAALHSIWRELADKRIEHGVDWPVIAHHLFKSLDDAEAHARTGWAVHSETDPLIRQYLAAEPEADR